MNQILCRYCNKSFEAEHGNTRICSPYCSKELKKSKVKENNTILKQLRTGFLDNYKLFVRFLPDAGSIEIPLLQLLKPGFDQHAFYGNKLSTSTNIVWHQVNEYLFYISTKNNQPILHLLKP